MPTAMNRPASPITKIAETVDRFAPGISPNAVPDVIDYPHDIQPVWDK
jgi:hypothetical protein